MVCKRYERLMVDYLAGELSQVDRERVRAHLRECASCANLFEEYREVIEKSKRIEVSIPEPDVWERKLSEIKAFRPHRIVIRIIKPAAVLVSLLIVSLFFARMTDNGKNRVAVRTGKNGYGIVLTRLPYSEKSILEKIDYIDEESASEILSVVLDTPTITLYEE
ncbi:MAG TPA: zf-HC2 domain-containing protein [bacterium]|nr:zf-HC2 domain-containing protein [bacterium]HPP29396.1 zf-HC2 domain-containing protein [bacterium]